MELLLPLPAVVCCSDDRYGTILTNRGSSSSSSTSRSLARRGLAPLGELRCSSYAACFWWKWGQSFKTRHGNLVSCELQLCDFVLLEKNLNVSPPAEGIAWSHQIDQTGHKSLISSSAQQPQSSPGAQQRSVTAVLVRCCDDDVHPNPHGDGVGSYQEEEAVVCLDAEGQTGPRRLRRVMQKKGKEEIIYWWDKQMDTQNWFPLLDRSKKKPQWLIRALQHASWVSWHISWQDWVPSCSTRLQMIFFLIRFLKIFF